MANRGTGFFPGSWIGPGICFVMQILLRNVSNCIVIKISQMGFGVLTLNKGVLNILANVANIHILDSLNKYIQ